MSKKEFDIKRAAALDALQTENTFTAAAAKAGISRRTLYGYLYSDAEFAFAYREQLRLRSVSIAEQAAQERNSALNAIRDIMNDVEQPGAVRLKAAEKLLEYAENGCNEEYKLSNNAVDVHTGFVLG